MLCPMCVGEGCARCEGRGNVPAQPNVLVESILARLVAPSDAPVIVPVLTPRTDDLLCPHGMTIEEDCPECDEPEPVCERCGGPISLTGACRWCGDEDDGWLL